MKALTAAYIAYVVDWETIKKKEEEEEKQYRFLWDIQKAQKEDW